MTDRSALKRSSLAEQHLAWQIPSCPLRLKRADTFADHLRCVALARELVTGQAEWD